MDGRVPSFGSAPGWVVSIKLIRAESSIISGDHYIRCPKRGLVACLRAEFLVAVVAVSHEPAGGITIPCQQCGPSLACAGQDCFLFIGAEVPAARTEPQGITRRLGRNEVD